MGLSVVARLKGRRQGLPVVVLLLLFKVGSCVEFGEVVLDVRDFGAVQGRSSTAAFRAATLAAANAGVATVLVPAGLSFTTGGFNLSSGTTLRVEGTIVGAADDAEFPIIPPLPSYGVSRDRGQKTRHQALIMATRASKIKILGSGTIDGGGEYWWGRENVAGRPRLIELYQCSDAEIGGLKFVNSAFWTVHPVYSDNIWLHDLTIRAPVDSPNTDGIDPDSSSNVLIERCDVSCGDDHIAIKSGMDEAGRFVNTPSVNITVRDCVFRSGNGISIGSEVSGGIENVLVDNCTLLGPSEHGLHIKTSAARGGYIRNVTYRNLVIENVTQDTALMSIKTDYGHHDDQGKVPLTEIAGIRYDGITTLGDAARGKDAANFFCFEAAPCQNIEVLNLDLRPAVKWSCSHVTNSSASNAFPIEGLRDCFGNATKTPLPL